MLITANFQISLNKNNLIINMNEELLKGEIASNVNAFANEVLTVVACTSVEQEASTYVDLALKNISIKTNDDQIKVLATLVKKTCETYPYK